MRSDMAEMPGFGNNQGYFSIYKKKSGHHYRWLCSHIYSPCPLMQEPGQF